MVPVESNFYQETLIGQLNWHDKKSASNQKWYKALRIIALVFSVLIPFLSGFINKEDAGLIPYAIGVSGIIIAICEGLLMLNKYQENWINYRKVAESLRREKTFYENEAGPYEKANDSLKMLVIRVSEILAKENIDWADRVRTEGDLT